MGEARWRKPFGTAPGSGEAMGREGEYDELNARMMT